MPGTPSSGSACGPLLRPLIELVLDSTAMGPYANESCPQQARGQGDRCFTGCGGRVVPGREVADTNRQRDTPVLVTVVRCVLGALIKRPSLRRPLTASTPRSHQ